MRLHRPAYSAAGRRCSASPPGGRGNLSPSVWQVPVSWLQIDIATASAVNRKLDTKGNHHFANAVVFPLGSQCWVAGRRTFQIQDVHIRLAPHHPIRTECNQVSFFVFKEYFSIFSSARYSEVQSVCHFGALEVIFRSSAVALSMTTGTFRSCCCLSRKSRMHSMIKTINCKNTRSIRMFWHRNAATLLQPQFSYN